MTRDELDDLHFIAPIANIPSILEHGILCHRQAQRLAHHSTANPEVQDRRARVRLPNGRWLHEYANLYICSRNPALYLMARDHGHSKLAVLRISTDVLDLPGVIITDGNAASDIVRWFQSPAGLGVLDRERVFAEYWTHAGDPLDYERHKFQKCAEVLVPGQVAPSLIRGAYVSYEESRQRLAAIAPGPVVAVDSHLFFR
jgi:hypothetical protein